MLSATTIFAMAGVPMVKWPHGAMMPSVNGVPAVMVVPAPLRIGRFGHRRGT
jgi:hypothetical protein